MLTFFINTEVRDSKKNVKKNNSHKLDEAKICYFYWKLAHE